MDRQLAIIVESIEPLSYNAKKRHRYAERIIGAAARWQCPLLAGGRLYCKVLYFHQGRRGIDADNLSKPVVDALKGCIYGDDAQIALRIAAKVDLAHDAYTVVGGAGLPQYLELQAMIADPAAEKDILYVEVGDLARVDLRLGVL